jgi:hypothetical protein
MFEPNSAADICREIQSLRSEIKNESDRAEFRFCFGVVLFICILLCVAISVAKLR